MRMPARLSAMDAGFLQVESSSAPMHLGWAAVFATPEHGPRPSFEHLREHVHGRLDRAPRYRQRLVDTPRGGGDPVWLDDETFDIARHVRRARTRDLEALVDDVMSSPLDRDSPLWQLWIADLDDGCIGVVGKAHHCLVDGLAAVELMLLLLDPAPNPDPDAGGSARPWVAQSGPPRGWLLADGLLQRARQALKTPGHRSRKCSATLAGSSSLIQLAGGTDPVDEPVHRRADRRELRHARRHRRTSGVRSRSTRRARLVARILAAVLTG